MGGQTVVILLVVACCVGYAAYRIYLSFRNIDNPCANCIGCPLKEVKQAANTRQARKNSQADCCADFKPIRKTRYDRAKSEPKARDDQSTKRAEKL